MRHADLWNKKKLRFFHVIPSLLFVVSTVFRWTANQVYFAICRRLPQYPARFTTILEITRTYPETINVSLFGHLRIKNCVRTASIRVGEKCFFIFFHTIPFFRCLPRLWFRLWLGAHEHNDICTYGWSVKTVANRFENANPHVVIPNLSTEEVIYVLCFLR